MVVQGLRALSNVCIIYEPYRSHGFWDDSWGSLFLGIIVQPACRRDGTRQWYTPNFYTTWCTTIVFHNPMSPQPDESQMFFTVWIFFATVLVEAVLWIANFTLVNSSAVHLHRFSLCSIHGWWQCGGMEQTEFIYTTYPPLQHWFISWWQRGRMEQIKT